MKTTKFLKLFVPQGGGKTMEGRYGAFLNDIVLSERSSELIVGHVPRIVNVFILELNTRCLHNAEVDLLFENPVNQFKKNKLKKILNTGKVDIDFSSFTTNIIFEAMMDFFLELKRPLLSPRRSHIRKLFAISKETDPSIHRKRLTVYLSDLPTSHYQTAKKLFIFLCQLSKHKNRVERTGERFIYELSHRFAKCCVGKFCTVKRLRPLRRTITLIITNAHVIFDHPEVKSLKVFDLSSESEEEYEFSKAKNRLKKIMEEGEDEDEVEGEDEDEVVIVGGEASEAEACGKNDLLNEEAGTEVSVEVGKPLSIKRFSSQGQIDDEGRSDGYSTSPGRSMLTHNTFTKDQVLLEVGKEYFNKEEFEVRLKLETEILRNRMKEEMESEVKERMKKIENKFDEKYGVVILNQKKDIEKLESEISELKRDHLTTSKKYLMVNKKIDGLDLRVGEVEKNGGGGRSGEDQAKNLLTQQKLQLDMDHLNSRVQEHQSRFKKLNFEITQLRLQLGISSPSPPRKNMISSKKKMRRRVKKRMRKDPSDSPEKLFRDINNVRKMIRDGDDDNDVRKSNNDYVPGMYSYTPISRRRRSEGRRRGRSSTDVTPEFKRDHGKSFLEYNSVRLNLLHNEIEDIMKN